MTEKTSIVGRLYDLNEKYNQGYDVSDFKIIDSDENLVAWSQASSEPVTVTDFNHDPEVLKQYETVTDYLANNSTYMTGLLDPASLAKDTPAEFIRDDNIRISSLLNKAMKMEDAPEEVKEAYRELKRKFNKADLTGFSEWAEAIKDYGIDVVANYETVPLVLAGIVSGGSLPAAGQAGVRAAMHTALKKGSAAASANPVKSAAAYSGAISGFTDLATQDLELSLDQREDISLGQATGATVLGAGIGGLLGYGASKVSNKLAARNLEADMSTDLVPTGLSESRALEIVDEAIEGEYIPASTNDVLNELDNLLEGSVARDVTPEPDETIINQFVNDVGGGEETREAVTNIVLNAVNSGATGEQIKNKAAFELYKLGTDLTGNVIGKASGILTPYTKFSKTAELLRKNLSHEFGVGLTKTKEVLGMDFSEVAARYTGNFNERYLKAIEPLALHSVKGTLADDVNAALNRAIRGEQSPDTAINTAAIEIRQLFKDIGAQLKDKKIIDKEVENYIPRMWNRKVIENDKERFAQLLVDQGEAANISEGIRIADSMLDIENQIQGGTGGHFFSAKRSFTDISDDSVFADFLEQDLLNVVSTYNFQAGKSFAKVDVLKVRNENEFIQRWVEPISNEMRKAGKTLNKREKNQILDLYRVTTSEGLTRYGDRLQTGVDGYALLNRLAYLPLATIGSLTEVFINIGKAGVINSVKGFGEALETSFKSISNDLHTDLMSRHGLTTNEAWRELKKHGMAMEQAQSQIGNRLAGDDLIHEGLQSVSNKFFRLNFLDQWTKFVQLTSFASGKNLIQENLEALASRGTQALDSRAETLIGELNELGLDYEKGVQWINNGARKDDEFYQDFVSGAARYTNSVILQPTAMSNLKPLLHSKPTTSILFQLLGYPAAFTNTVLKGASKALIQSPVRNAPKIAAAGLVMTESARWMNWLRSRGENEKDKDLGQIYSEAVVRWGGNGVFLDSIQRAQKSAMYTNNVGAYLTTPFGPAAADAFSLSQGKIVSTAGQKVPGIGTGNIIFGPEVMKKYRKSLREVDKELADKLIPEFDYNVSKEMFSAGGEVHEREGFAIGSIASKASKMLTTQAAETIDRFTDGIFSEKTLNEVGDNIDLDLKPMMTGRTDDPDMPMDEESEIIEAYIDVNLETLLNEKHTDMSPEVYKIFKEDEFGGERFQEARGYTDEEIENFYTTEALADELGDVFDIDSAMQAHLKDVIAKYQVLGRDGYREIPKEVEEMDGLINFLTELLLETRAGQLEGITLDGVQTGVKQQLTKIISEKDTKTIKAIETLNKGDYKIVDPFEEFKVDSKKASTAEEFTKDSVIKEPVYRGITSFLKGDRDVAFFAPREMGVHVGNEGQSNYILAKAANSNAAEDALTKSDLTRKDISDFFSDEADFRSEQLQQLSDIGYPVDEIDNVKPLTMTKGYINIQNPLRIVTDKNTWSSEYLFFADSVDFVEAIETNLGRKLTKKENKQFNTLAEDAKNLSDVLVEEQEKLKSRADLEEKDFISTIEDLDAIEYEIKYDLQVAAHNKEAQEFLKSLGFDSIVYKNEGEVSLISEGEEQVSYILFDPEQFKNINAALFDTKDPRNMRNAGGHVVKRGETLTAIASRYKTNIQELIELNDLESPNKIYVDQKLVVPALPTNKAATAIKNKQLKNQKTKAALKVNKERKANNLKEVTKALKKQGFSNNAVAGILANIEVETGGSYDFKQKQVKGPGRGLFQLDPSGPLPKAYKAWKGEREDSIEAQVEFMHDTIYGDNKNVIGAENARKLRDAFDSSSAEDIAKEFSNRWERPSKPHMDRRQAAAKAHAARMKFQEPLEGE